ncbi:MAG TPA: tRNA uridine(34) 5-carboxymethylaminomethyl modification radical SAM/GNAT enzyme Elp3 [Vitreimonas sp.]|nr:tRNA uridine(34) 5-carboxymethylaminomethyl modification radical SAM/GNAT enzyme Elp3 [Vitreimonas sp.]
MTSYHFEYQLHLDQLLPLLSELEKLDKFTEASVRKITKKYPKPDKAVFSKDELLKAYRELAGTQGLQPTQEKILHYLTMKPIRTMSGVTPVTVLTKPFPCPGTCIFCPNDIRMPKSYLSDEPGAQRAERNYFDPYLQTYNRLQAFQNIGHSVDKVELIVLGGTWSYYPESYQIWFIKECLRALNEFGIKDDRIAIEERYQQMSSTFQNMQRHAPSNNPAQNKQQLASQQIQGEHFHKTYNQAISELYVAPERLAGFDKYQSATWEELESEQKINETAASRSVGLVIETRPDNISEAEVLRVRRLGCTKTQIGFQSLSDEVLTKNKRGHDVAATRRAVNLLRQAGFKIHAHWMANLYGSSVELDKQDYLTLFSDPDFKPDELKIYPCSLIESAELMQYYQAGKWQPYTYEELLDVLTFCLQQTPQYCRLTRVIRDIPSTDIVVGNKLTNFRQIAEQKLATAGERSQDIRAREIKNTQFVFEDLELDEIKYDTAVSTEIFLQYVIKETHQIAAFLRLSLPKQPSFVEELKQAAIIREVHVYGQAVDVGDKAQGRAQHLGLGTRLIERAKELAHQAYFPELAVISAIGTREYYRKRGFKDGKLYQNCELG